MANYSVSLDSEIVKKFRDISKKNGAKLSPVINVMLENYINQNSKSVMPEPPAQAPSLLKEKLEKPIPIIPKHFEEIKPVKKFNRI